MISVIAGNGEADERRQGFCSGKNDPIPFRVVDFAPEGEKNIRYVKDLPLLEQRELLFLPNRWKFCVKMYSD